MSFLPLILVGLYGLSFCAALLPASGLSRPFLFSFAVCLPIGLALYSFAFFAFLFIWPSYAHSASCLLLSALSLLCIWFRRKEGAALMRSIALFDLARVPWKRLSLSIPILLLLLLSLFSALSFFLNLSLNEIHGSGDARVFWNVKAKFLYREPELWRRLFSRELAFAHPDYPLLLPAAVAYGWFFEAQEILAWPAVLAGTFYLSLALLIFWSGYVLSGFPVALLMTSFYLLIPRYVYEAAAQYADLPLCFFMFAAALMFFFKRNSQNLIFIAFFAAAAAWTKSEGLFFSALLLSLVTLELIFRSRLRLGNVLPLFTVFGLLIIPTLSVRFLLAESADFHISSLGPNLEHLSVIFPAYSRAFFYDGEWAGLWILGALSFSLAVLCRRGRVFCLPSLSLLSLFFLQNLFYLVIYSASPHDIEWHLQTSLKRLLMHSSVLLFPLLAYWFAPSVEEENN